MICLSQICMKKQLNNLTATIYLFSQIGTNNVNSAFLRVLLQNLARCLKSFTCLSNFTWAAGKQIHLSSLSCGYSLVNQLMKLQGTNYHILRRIACYTEFCFPLMAAIQFKVQSAIFVSREIRFKQLVQIRPQWSLKLSQRSQYEVLIKCSRDQITSTFTFTALYSSRMTTIDSHFIWNTMSLISLWHLVTSEQ